MQNGVARGGQGKIWGGPYVTFFRYQSKSVHLEDHFWGGHWGGHPFIWGGHGHPRPPLRNAPANERCDWCQTQDKPPTLHAANPMRRSSSEQDPPCEFSVLLRLTDFTT